MTEQKKSKRQAPKDLWIKAPAGCTEGLEEIAKKHKIPVADLRRAIARDLTELLEGGESITNPSRVAARFPQARAALLAGELAELQGARRGIPVSEIVGPSNRPRLEVHGVVDVDRTDSAGGQ